MLNSECFLSSSDSSDSHKKRRNKGCKGRLFCSHLSTKSNRTVTQLLVMAMRQLLEADRKKMGVVMNVDGESEGVRLGGGKEKGRTEVEVKESSGLGSIHRARVCRVGLRSASKGVRFGCDEGEGGSKKRSRSASPKREAVITHKEGCLRPVSKRGRLGLSSEQVCMEIQGVESEDELWKKSQEEVSDDEGAAGQQQPLVEI